MEFPDEDILNIEESSDIPWKIYFDGAHNKAGRGVGVILELPNGVSIPIALKLEFDCTNNIAEYEACIAGLQAALALSIREVAVYGDSLLIINQVQEKWKLKDKKLIPYHKYLTELIKEFDRVEFRHIYRDKNKGANALAILASCLLLPREALARPIEVFPRESPAYCYQISEPEEQSEPEPWYTDIKQFLESQEYPEGCGRKGRRALRRQALHYIVLGDHLYRRSPDGMLLRVVSGAETMRILERVHAGICGPHMNGLMLAKKILRYGYYWNTMINDSIRFVQKCHECQIHADLNHIPPSLLNTISSPWPFSTWGIDVVGKVNPSASNGHTFIIVAIDYFTKWVEAISCKSIKSGPTARFIQENIISRYGVPYEIISDNGKNFVSAEVREMLQSYKINYRTSSLYRPQTNGAVEAMNKTLVKILKKMTSTYKDWSDKLPYALLAYRTSIRTATGATPFSLVYGMEAVLPVEVDIPTIRVLKEGTMEEAEWIQSRVDQLNFVDEARLKAACHAQAYQQRIARSFNKRVRPRNLKE